MVNKNGTTKYSKIVFIKVKDDGQNQKLVILENPVNSTVNFMYTAANDEEEVVNIYNTGGAKVYSTKIAVRKGTNTVSLNIDQRISSGIYIMELTNTKERSVAKLIKQ